jgi:hypothetical protein
VSLPTFADLCEEVRRARIAHRQAIRATAEAQAALKDAKAAQEAACDVEDDARDALDRFIDQETTVE